MNSFRYDDDEYYRVIRRLQDSYRTIKFSDGSEMKIHKISVVKNRKNVAKEITEDIFGDCEI